MRARFFVTLLALTAAGPLHAQPRYNLYDLGDLGNIVGLTTGFSAGNSVNLAGQVAGSALTSDFHSVGFRTGSTGLGSGASSLLGLDTEAYGINGSGQITGNFQIGPDSAPIFHAFRTSAAGVVGDPKSDIGAWPGGRDSKGRAINSSGQVTGYANVGIYSHAFRTSATGLVSDAGTDLGVLPGSTGSQGNGINARGQVTGFSQFASSGNVIVGHAFRTTPTGSISDPGTDLGTLGGTTSDGKGINDSGQVTGVATTSAGQPRAFRTTANGSISDPGTDLGILPGGNWSDGEAINALGAVVGGATVAGGAEHAFLYTTQMWDLNNLIEPGTGWVLNIARSINDNGWITGKSAANRGFLLIPVDNDPGLRPAIHGVPEPSSLVTSAVAMLVGWTLRRRRMAHARSGVTAA